MSFDHQPVAIELDAGCEWFRFFVVQQARPATFGLAATSNRFAGLMRPCLLGFGVSGGTHLFATQNHGGGLAPGADNAGESGPPRPLIGGLFTYGFHCG
jgi:hypothetical protein